MVVVYSRAGRDRGLCLMILQYDGLGAGKLFILPMVH